VRERIITFSKLSILLHPGHFRVFCPSLTYCGNPQLEHRIILYVLKIRKIPLNLILDENTIYYTINQLNYILFNLIFT
jgi:hypothetical protein